MNQICVVIPTYNFFDMTKECVELVKEHAGIGVDILVVDDGSDTPYIDSSINVIRIEKNSGATNAVNQGILWCSDRYKYIMLMDNDIIPEPNFIKHLYEHMESDPVTGIASSVRIDRRPEKPLYELNSIDLLNGHLLCLYRCNDEMDVIYCDWLNMCCALVRTEMFRYIGILDRQFAHYCTDSDLCIRANQNGWNVAIVPKSKAEHKISVTMHAYKKEFAPDQKLFVEKLIGKKTSELMDRIPFNIVDNTWGRLRFEVYKKKDESK